MDADKMNKEAIDCYGREWIKANERLETSEVEEVVGIIKKEGRYYCARCLNENQNFFAKVDKVVYCRNCLTFGKITEKTVLLRSHQKAPVCSLAGQVNETFKLSPLQQQAAKKAVEAFENRKDHYTWAVCGAGKTEMMFQVISVALSQGYRVCWAIPRKDVVIELKPRLQQAFLQAKVVALYGNSPDQHQYGDLVLSTTHQLIHFHEAFELIIIDEVDAFPYTHDEMLPRLLQKSKTKTGVTLYLSATPSTPDKQKMKNNSLSSFIIPVRYHQYPLDVPKFKGCYHYEAQLAKGKVPIVLKRYLHHQKQNNRKTLLFVPTIKIGEQLSELLAIPFVHSQDTLREEKVGHYKQSTDLFLLTTMILERGITIVNIDVAILGAEDEVFEESALVQISGRVGRHPKYPHGNITFFHDGVSKAMISAHDHIKMMNQRGVANGLLKM